MPRHASLACLGPNGFHRVAYTEWGDAANPRVVVCVHGLARNRRDFDFLARHLADAFRVVSVDVVGRGDSDWLKAKEDYRFGQYLADSAALIARITAPAGGALGRLAARLRGRGAASLDWIGTSMGGLIGIMLAARAGNPIRRLVLNDVGPLVPWSSLVRLKGYVGRSIRFESMQAVEEWVREVCASWGALTDAQVAHLARRRRLRAALRPGHRERAAPARRRRPADRRPVLRGRRSVADVGCDPRPDAGAARRRLGRAAAGHRGGDEASRAAGRGRRAARDRPRARAHVARADGSRRKFSDSSMISPQSTLCRLRSGCTKVAKNIARPVEGVLGSGASMRPRRIAADNHQVTASMRQNEEGLQ